MQVKKGKRIYPFPFSFFMVKTEINLIGCSDYHYRYNLYLLKIPFMSLSIKSITNTMLCHNMAIPLHPK